MPVPWGVDSDHILKDVMLLLTLWSQLRFNLEDMVDEGESEKEFEDSDTAVTVDARENTSSAALLLEYFEDGDTLSDDKDNVRLLWELGLEPVHKDLVISWWSSVLTLFTAAHLRQVDDKGHLSSRSEDDWLCPAFFDNK